MPATISISHVAASDTALGVNAAVVPSTMVPPRAPTGPSVVFRDNQQYSVKGLCDGDKPSIAGFPSEAQDMSSRDQLRKAEVPSPRQ